MMLSSIIALCALACTLVQSAPTADPFSFYYMPTSLAGPCDLATGPDGAIWVQDQLVNKLARVDPETGKVDEYEIPWTTPALPFSSLPNVGGRVALACVVRTGCDGHLYAANGVRNQLVQMNVTTKEIKVFTPPNNLLGNLQPFNDAYSAPDGVYFTQTTNNLLTFFDFATESFTSYMPPTPESVPVGVFYASDHNIYMTELIGNNIARFNTATKTFTTFPVPVPLTGPAVVRAETDNRYIWFTGFTGNSMGRFDMKTHEIETFVNPSPASFPTEDTVDGQGRVWFSTATQNTLNYIQPSTLKFTSIEIPDTALVAPVSVPFGFNIAVHYGPDNAIWFTQELYNRVGKYKL